MMNMQDKIEKLKQLIGRSKEERGAFSRNGFGFAIVTSENYDAIPQEELTILEKEYCVSLPNEYKAFVTEIANGGVHPMCGLFNVQESLALNRMRKEDLVKGARKIIVSRFLDCAGYDEYSESMYLHPENPDYPDIPITDCQIQGVAVYVLKSLGANPLH